MATRAKLFSQLAKSVDTSGTITSAGISSTVSLGATVYDSVGLLPTSGVNAGDQAFVTSTSRLYINSGVGWYNVAVINSTPVITSITDSDGASGPFSLSTEGIDTTITIVATDSDTTDTITYSATADSGFNGLASISQSGDTFTISPLSSDSATAISGTITFKATDGINIANSIQSFTLNFLSEYWDETVLSIGTSSTNSLDNSTFIDRSTNAHGVTTSGTPTQTAFHPYLDHYSMDFDGNHSITVPTIASGNGEGLYTTGNSFTLESWVYFKSWPATDQGYNEAILNSSVAAGTSAPWCLGVVDVSGTKKIFTQYWDGSVARYVRGDSSLELNTWYHLAWSVDSGKMRLFIDGVEETVTTNMTLTDGYPTIATPAQTTGWHIGQDRGRKSDMYIMNWRLVNGYALYSADFTPSETITDVTGTWMMLTGNNRLDKSSNNQTVVSYFDPPPISAFNPFGQGSEYTSGENKGSVFSSDGGDYLAVPQIDLGTGDFTIECWHYSRSRINTRNGIWSNYSSYSGGALGLFAGHQSGTNTLYQVAYNGGSFPAAGLQGGTIAYNQWNHIAVVRSSGTMDLYVNGTSVASKTLTADLDGVGSNFYINTPGDNLTYGIDGYIADFSVDVGTAKYTSDFTPPTSPVGNSGKDLYLPMDNPGIFDKTGNHTLTLNGDASTSNTQTKFADTAIYFDGTGDYIVADTLSDFAGDLTWEIWAYPISHGSGSTDAIASTYLNSSNGITFGIHASTGKYYFAVAGDNNRLDDTNNLPLNQWTHLAGVRSGSTVTLYVNGTSVATTTNSATLTSTSQLHIGTSVGGGNLNFNGYLEGLQILNGVAKYTTNFTPPTQTQGRIYQAES